MDSTAKMMNFYFKFDFNSVFSLVSLWNFLPDLKKKAWASSCGVRDKKKMSKGTNAQNYNILIFKFDF